MLDEKIAILDERIAELTKEWALYKAIRDDFVCGTMQVVNVRTDSVYQAFCARHPDTEIGQRGFSRILCAVLDLKSVQGYLDGERGSFYEHR